jgi:hypothetical protein
MELTQSQALRRINDLKGKLKDHLERAVSGISHKEVAPPAFEFGPTMEKAELTRKELIELQARAAITNAQTHFEFEGKKMVLAMAVHTLQELRSQLAWTKVLPVRAHAKMEESEWAYNEKSERIQVKTTWTCHLPEVRKAEELEKLQDYFNRLNTAVESVNHVTKLIKL